MAETINHTVRTLIDALEKIAAENGDGVPVVLRDSRGNDYAVIAIEVGRYGHCWVMLS